MGDVQPATLSDLSRPALSVHDVASTFFLDSARDRPSFADRFQESDLSWTNPASYFQINAD
jgi:hypothetical protein